VVVEGVVDEDGCMRQVRAVESTDKKLEAAAIEAAGQWVFEPATRNGAPVRVLYTVTLNGH
jgi:TonB family protein